MSPQRDLAAAAARNVGLAQQADSMAESCDFLARLCREEGPDKDGKTEADYLAEAADYRGQAAGLRRKAARLQAEAAQTRTVARDPSPAQVRRVGQRRESRRRNVRTSGRRTRAPGSKGDEPEPDLIRLSAASSKLWARVRRREAKHRLAVA